MKWGPLNMNDRMWKLNSHITEKNWVLRHNGWTVRQNGSFDDMRNHWLHSDMKDVSFFYNFKFYEKVIEKGSLQ